MDETVEDTADNSSNGLRTSTRKPKPIVLQSYSNTAQSVRSSSKRHTTTRTSYDSESSSQHNKTKKVKSTEEPAEEPEEEEEEEEESKEDKIERLSKLFLTGYQKANLVDLDRINKQDLTKLNEILQDVNNMNSNNINQSSFGKAH